MISPGAGVAIAGRYTLLRALAQGGMGSVWVARHRELEIDVTIKFMSSSLVASSDARARFEREAKSAARLGSQHVVQVLDYGVEDDTPYMVMELLKGESLWTRLAREGRLPLPDTARLVMQVCKALRTAHDSGLVHRDLKPGNIFLAVKDEDVVAVVLDFGIAKATSFGEAQTNTESGMLLGSAHYMSPEQIRNSRKVDHRSDLWSLGVILYRMLVGRLPFPGGDIGDVLVRVCTDPLPLPSAFAPDLPTTADGFFARALSRDPDQRYQSARELAAAFSAMALAAPPLSSSEPAAPRVALEAPILALTDALPAAPHRAFDATLPLVATAPLAVLAAVPSVPVPTSTQVLSSPSREGASVVSNPALISGAEVPTVAIRPLSEEMTGPVPAVSLPGSEPTLKSAPIASVAPARPPRRWLMGVALGVVAVAGIIGVSVGRPATPAGPTADSAAPAVATVSASPTVPSATAQESDTSLTVQTAMIPGASASALTRQRDGSAEIIRRNPFSADSPAQAPTIQPRAPAAAAGTAKGRAGAPERAPTPTAKPTANGVNGPLENSL